MTLGSRRFGVLGTGQARAPRGRTFASWESVVALACIAWRIPTARGSQRDACLRCMCRYKRREGKSASVLVCTTQDRLIPLPVKMASPAWNQRLSGGRIGSEASHDPPGSRAANGDRRRPCKRCLGDRMPRRGPGKKRIGGEKLLGWRDSSPVSLQGSSRARWGLFFVGKHDGGPREVPCSFYRASAMMRRDPSCSRNDIQSTRRRSTKEDHASRAPGSSPNGRGSLPILICRRRMAVGSAARARCPTTSLAPGAPSDPEPSGRETVRRA